MKLDFPNAIQDEQVTVDDILNKLAKLKFPEDPKWICGYTIDDSNLENSNFVTINNDCLNDPNGPMIRADYVGDPGKYAPKKKSIKQDKPRETQRQRDEKALQVAHRLIDEI